MNYENIHPGYSEMVEFLNSMPSSQLPGLLFHVIKNCVEKKVFKEGGIESYVFRVCGELTKTKGSK